MIHDIWYKHIQAWYMTYGTWHMTYDMIQLDIMWCDVIWNSFDVLWLPGPILILNNNDTWHAKESHPRIGHLVIFAPTTVPFRCAWVCSGGHAITPMRGCMVRETAITSSGQTLTSRVPPHEVFQQYQLVMSNIAMERSTMLLRTVNHLFLWAIYTMAMFNQRVDL